MKALCLPVAVAALLLAVGCGDNSNPLLVDVAHQFGASYCKKLAVCMGTKDFNLAYPGGIQDCTARTYHIYGTDERSVCSQEQWDVCTTDLEHSTCVTAEGASRPKIPDSCQGC